MSKEFFNITPHTSGEGFQMTLSNGSIDIPDERGCYVISTGCGSGKTECCKSLIRQKHHEGILYCVDTKTELEKVYNWIMGNLAYLGLKREDVLMLNSDTDYVETLRSYKNDPAEIMKIPVLLITHVRFWTDLINYFLIYKPQNAEGAFDGDFSRLMARNDLRKYILFDETPFFIKPFITIDKMTLGCFSTKDSAGNLICMSIPEMRENYNDFIKGEINDPFPKQDSKLNKLKLEVIFNMIPKLFPKWLKTKGKLDITFTPSDLCQDSVESHVIIFEGAGDVLFTGGSKFKLLDISKKYNCNLNFSCFPFRLKRRRMDGIADENEIKNFIATIANLIKANQKKGEKSLVVVWKNYGKGNYDTNDTGFIDMVRSKLAKQRKICKDFYEVIYYGSPFGKSTNEFKDFTNIILCGTWHIVNSETTKFNEHFGTIIKNENHIQWYYTQLLSRIGVRKHDGRTYNIFYSEDYSPSFMDKLNDVFYNKPVASVIPDPAQYPDWLNEKFESLKIRINHRPEIASLINYDYQVGEAIKTGTPFTLTLSLNDIAVLVPRSRKKRGEYKRLKNVLGLLDITLCIS